ncbi:hypothetical protein KBX06_16940 [Micromonospora sp. C31]|uniref:hypothetical protein n=1 Tax=Micromonospora sp. C31 TaxID=2824876 RepID=UPI001B388873|nr:hypothetical protein [Micromonospora sp. C31]MBQ1074838.1 hypothetical protein [Micromonospora sp. C31]
MKPGPLPAVDLPDDDAAPAAELPRRGRLPVGLGDAGRRPEEPLAVIGLGPAGAGRSEVLARLLRLDPAMLAVPAGSWLVVRHSRVPTRAAYVPGYRQPHSYGADRLAAGPALARPPRRVELSLPEPLLRHFSLVDTPDTGALGVAGGQLLFDAAVRSGAALFVIAADQAFTAVELHLLADLARAGVQVVFAVTPGASGWAPVPEGAGASVGSAPAPVDPVAVTVEAHRAALLAAVPGLADARWFPLRASGDGADLRRALVGWAADEGLRRASAEPPVLPGSHGRVPVVADPGDWSEQLDRQARSSSRRIRQHLSLELANIHLRVVQEIVFGVGCAGLPQLLDQEMEALSLLATAQCDEAVRGLIEGAAGRVLGAPLPTGVRRRLRTPVRWALAEHRGEHELDRVLLVTSTGGVAGLTGAGATDALASYPGVERVEVLPPVAVALSGGCWQHWRSPGNHDPNAARAWTQRALREVELELSREVSRRFEVVRLSLDGVLSDAVDHGILLA